MKDGTLARAHEDAEGACLAWCALGRLRWIAGWLERLKAVDQEDQEQTDYSNELEDRHDGVREDMLWVSKCKTWPFSSGQSGDDVAEWGDGDDAHISVALASTHSELHHRISMKATGITRTTRILESDTRL